MIRKFCPTSNLPILLRGSCLLVAFFATTLGWTLSYSHRTELGVDDFRQDGYWHFYGIVSIDGGLMLGKGQYGNVDTDEYNKFGWSFHTQGLIQQDTYLSLLPGYCGFGKGYFQSTDDQPLSGWCDGVVVPYWFLLLLQSLPIAIFVRVVKKRRGADHAGICPKCGYDLRATPNRCPECGLIVKLRAVSVGIAERRSAMEFLGR